MKMDIIKNLVTKNRCYTLHKIILPKGLILHSVGCAQPSAKVFMNNWNKASAKVCVHGIIDANTGAKYQTLPWNYKAWHVGDSANNTHIGIEMCEPDCIKYKKNSSTFVCSNIERAREMVIRTYNSAVEYFAYLCEEFKFNPLKDILSHREAHAKGIASDHGDPEHLWAQLGLPYTMDTFRKDVYEFMNKNDHSDDTNMYKVQVGAYTDKNNAQKLQRELKSKGFDTYATKIDGYWKVQVGVYNLKENAETMLNNVKKAGYSDAFITIIELKEELEPEIVVGDKVKVINPITYDGKKFKLHYKVYNVIEVKGDRIVIGIKKIVTAAVHVDNLVEVF